MACVSCRLTTTSWGNSGMLTVTRSPFRTLAALNPAAALRASVLGRSDRAAGDAGVAALRACGARTGYGAAKVVAPGSCGWHDVSLPGEDSARSGRPGARGARRHLRADKSEEARRARSSASRSIVSGQPTPVRRSSDLLLYGGPSFEGLESLLARKGYYESASARCWMRPTSWWSASAASGRRNPRR